MRLVADGHVVVRGLVHLRGDLLGADDDHHVAVPGDLLQGLVDALAVHREVHDDPVEPVHRLPPRDAGAYGVIPAEPLDHAADVLLQHMVLGVDVDPARPERPG